MSRKKSIFATIFAWAHCAAVQGILIKYKAIKIFKYIFGTVAVIAFLLFLSLMSLRLAPVKSRLASYASAELAGRYGIPLDVEEVEVRGLNDIRLRNVVLHGIDGDTVVCAEEARAYLQTKRLLDGEVRVNTLVFAAPDVRLSRTAPGEELNIQFLVDLLSRDKKEEKSRIDLRINQLLMYDGRLSYDVLSEARDSIGFDPEHILVTDFACNLSLKELRDDRLDLYIRSISGKESCGLEVERLRANVLKEGDSVAVDNLELRTPHSNIVADRVVACADSIWSDVVVSGNVRSNCFAPDDVALFVDLPADAISPVRFSMDGYYRKDSADVVASLSAIDDSYGIKATAMAINPFAEQMQGRVIVDNCFADENVMATIVSYLKPDSPAFVLTGLAGGVHLSGDVSFDKDKLGGCLAVGCESGAIAANGYLASNWDYRLLLNGKELNMEKLAGVDGLETCEVNVEASGNLKAHDNYGTITGSVENLVYKGYHYAPIEFSGHCAADLITARLDSDDPNAKMRLTAKYSIADDRMLKLTLRSDRIAPTELNLYPSDKSQAFSFDLNGEYIDYGAGRTIMNAKIDNLYHMSGGDTTFVRNFYVSDNNAGEDRIFMVTSDFASASIYGDFDFKRIKSSLAGILKSHLPVLNITHDNDASPSFVNDFYYDVAITNTVPLTKMFNLPVTVLEPSGIKGVFNERENIFNVDGSINKINLNGGLIRALSINGKSGHGGLDLNVQLTKPLSRKKKDFDNNDQTEDIVVRINANVESDKIKGIVNWNNFKTDDVMMGMVRMDAGLGRNTKRELELTANIYEDSIIHKNRVWHVNEGTVSGRIDRLHVENIGLYSEGQSLKIEGVLGKEVSDSLNAYLNDVDVAAVFDFIKFKTLEFGGRASGTALGTGLLSAPNAGGHLTVENFSIDGAVLGDGNVYVGWENDTKSIVLGADIYNRENELSTVKGFLSQPNDTITLRIDAKNLNAAFLDKKLDKFISGIDGTASGNVHIHGGWRLVDLEGAVALYCSAKVNANNTRYYFTGDSIRFSRGIMAFDNARIYDRFGNRGSLSGQLGHSNMSQWTCNFNIKANEMLVYDTDDFGTLPFYGTVFATGDAMIKSDGTGFLLKANAKSMPGSRFIYNSNVTSGARDNSFVTFTDNSRRKKKEELPILDVEKKNAFSKTASKLTLDFMLDVNEHLDVKVYTNLQNDDYISLSGAGPVNAIYDDKTGFSMKGNLNLVRGLYKFTIQDIFPKVFDISKGSTIAFNGDPFRAALNLKAKYLVPSASLSDLSTEIARRKTVKVNCVMDITGTLASPNLAFDLELPEGSEEERELLASVASTPDQKNMQFVYLLGVGKFYTFDTNNAQAGMTNSSSAVESLISNTISGQINNMLGKIINNGNWDISGNISTSERGWNSMEVEGMLRGRLLDNRLQINGNLGYRENPIANRNVIGDFELLWLLSPKYNWNIKAYSKTNDRYFSKTDLTTQGVGTSILFEFDRWKWWGKKKKKKAGEDDSTQPVDVEETVTGDGDEDEK